MIEHIGTDWILFSHEGKVLGRHKTRLDAKAQEHAINISKARRAGYRIPKPKPPGRRRR